MAHFRKQFRDDSEARLEAALTTADVKHINVYCGRLALRSPAECSAIMIITASSVVNCERKNVGR